MVNTYKIKKRMKELGLTQRVVADRLTLAVPTVSQKINNLRPISLEEAGTLCSLLELSREEFLAYFFVNNIALRK